MLINNPVVTRTHRLLIQTVSSRCLTKTSQQPRPEKKHYRLWSLPGEFVHYKEVLARQYTMLWHPGLNVGIDHARTIYALCDGIMTITEEQFNPDWEYPLVKQVYLNKDGEKRAPPYKRYIHVIPKKKISEFKLIDVV